jgi:hypothetical protein
MILVQIPCCRRRHPVPVRRPARAQRPKRIEDHRDIYNLLDERSGDRGQPSERSGPHGRPGKGHSDNDALQGDESRAPRYGDRIRNALELIDKNDHIGRLGRRARAASSHGDADVSRRQGRSVINAVADHQGRVKPLLHCDGLDLVGWNTIREHGVEAESGADRLGRVGPVASHHDDPRHAGAAKRSDSPRHLTAQFVRKQQSADRAPVH